MFLPGDNMIFSEVEPNLSEMNQVFSGDVTWWGL